MKKLAILLIILAFSLKACSQDQTFNKPVYFNAGFYINGKLYNDIPTGTVPDWNSIINKPSVFPAAAHNHDLLYWPINKKVDWNTDIINLPQQMSLSDAIEKLGYLPIPSWTTTEINALVIPAGKRGLVYDNVLKVYKLYDGTLWSKIVITNQ
jgi:hypothetical protein